MCSRDSEELRDHRPREPRTLDERREPRHDQLPPELADRRAAGAPDERVERLHGQPELGSDRGDRRALGPGDLTREKASADRAHQRRVGQQLVERGGQTVPRAPIRGACGLQCPARGARRVRDTRAHDAAGVVASAPATDADLT